MSITAKLKTILTMGVGVTKGFTELDVADDPIAFFGKWFEDARSSGMLHPEAMAVATATKDGTPSSRMMLLKGFGPDGFLFYTNYGSRKASELDENPRASLTFYWAVLERQVRIEGRVTRQTTDESRAYFRTRPRGSQIGAWASEQSSPLASRDELIARVKEYEAKFANHEVPLPPFWGGYRLTPRRMEFWQGRLNRLHDRLVYRRQESGWEVTRVAP